MCLSCTSFTNNSKKVCKGYTHKLRIWGVSNRDKKCGHSCTLRKTLIKKTTFLVGKKYYLKYEIFGGNLVGILAAVSGW